VNQNLIKQKICRPFEKEVLGYTYYVETYCIIVVREYNYYI
jgi:hypothetical protein